ncbi:hypothetical protein [Bacillus cereus]|uniref:hypothetical protein n=1 Tax=Bacillus cereus TaxID=1396 RepID=UPI000BFA60F0|nr:hypothetical protein [Bacillus cereus]PFC92474.1 hypothetical protein CN308_23225 [Bacillus cereus]
MNKKNKKRSKKNVKGFSVGGKKVNKKNVKKLINSSKMKLVKKFIKFVKVIIFCAKFVKLIIEYINMFS